MIVDNPMSPSGAFNRCIPTEVLRKFVEILARSYRDAYEECDRKYEKPEAHDLYPHLRRSLIEQRLRMLLAEFPQITAIARTNPRQTSCYTEIRCGRILLTQSFVETPQTIVRDAEFRKTYARDANLLLDNDWVDAPMPAPDQALYTILIHGPSDVERYLLGFAQIVFPSKDNTCYEGRIDLGCHFPDLFELSRVPEEVIKDAAQPRLRKDSKKVEGQ